MLWTGNNFLFRGQLKLFCLSVWLCLVSLLLWCSIGLQRSACKHAVSSSSYHLLIIHICSWFASVVLWYLHLLKLLQASVLLVFSHLLFYSALASSLMITSTASHLKYSFFSFSFSFLFHVPFQVYFFPFVKLSNTQIHTDYPSALTLSSILVLDTQSTRSSCWQPIFLPKLSQASSGWSWGSLPLGRSHKMAHESSMVCVLRCQVFILKSRGVSQWCTFPSCTHSPGTQVPNLAKSK